MAINYINGDIFSEPVNDKINLLIHQVNCMGAMGAGLALDVKSRYPDVYIAYKEICNQTPELRDLLGRFQIIKTRNNRYVCNTFTQFDYGNRSHTSIDAIKKCFTKINTKLDGRKDVLFRIPNGFGCGLGGGNWDDVDGVIHECFDQSSFDVEIVKKIPTQRILIIGSRKFKSYDELKSKCDLEISNRQDKRDIIIVSGGAKGADSLAKKYALENDFLYDEYPAYWNLYGKRAGYLRNNEMVKDLNWRDLCIAFTYGTKGTANTISLCQNENIPIKIYRYQ